MRCSLDKASCCCCHGPCAGNNAVEMETTATFDRASDEFIVHTPSALGQKYWITNSAVHAHVRRRYRQLYC